jgi:outer membrane protein assembly factor BamB
MIDRFLKFRMMSAVLVGAFALSACSTISNVTDAINPFDGKDDVSQGDIPTDPERISILSLNDTLEVAGTILPSEIVLPAVYTNPDWPQTGGYATHAPQRTNVPGNLNKIWSKGVGKGSNRKGRVVSSPVVAGGVIYTVDGNNKVVAMDANTGSSLWDYKIRVAKTKRTRKGGTSLVDRVKDPFIWGDKGGSDKEAVGGGVAVSDGRIYVTSGFGLAVALDATTGSEIWRTRTRTPIHSAPAVDNGRMFAVSDDNELFAFDADTGAILWTYQAIIETARMLTAPAPAIIDDVVIAPFSSGEIVALRVQNGGVLWQDSLDASGLLTPLAALNDIGSGPVVADGYVFASAQSGSLGAFDLRTGQRVWSQPAGSLGFPLVVGDFIFTVTTEGQVACLSKADGTVIWLTQLQAFKNVKKRKKRIAWAGPIMAGERLLVMGSNGRAIEVSPFDGSIIRNFKLSGEVYVPPIVANDTVYYITDGAKLVALR